MSESTEQQALFEWAEFAAKKTPELKLLFAVPNGGKRNITTAARLKKEGVNQVYRTSAFRFRAVSITGCLSK